MLKAFGSFIVFLAILFLPQSVIAAYVLPYPSYMPGNKLYKVSRVIDQLKQYWYWGSIASMKYQLGLADKYLVEAKTLFEYRQYLLGVEALQRSNRAVQQQNTYLLRAQKDGKDMHHARQIASEAMSEHEGLLKKLMEELPSEFLWQPEKQTAQVLHIRQELINAQTIRFDLSNIVQNE